jgi:uncharacterized protein (TIGR03790 family)
MARKKLSLRRKKSRASCDLISSNLRRLLTAVLLAGILAAQGPENVLLVVNQRSAVSRSIGDYYALKRRVPLANICRIQAPVEEDIGRADYDAKIAAPIAGCLRESILYIVTTSGVPLRITGSDGQSGDQASVDSELALLYSDMHGAKHAIAGPLRNPFFGRKDAKFAHPEFPIYLVTRLTGYDFADVKAIIDRSLAARNQGKFVIDLKSNDDAAGNNWLRNAALALPKERVVFDDSEKVLERQTGVIGYASWGSNDPHRQQRTLDFQWLPGAIMTEYVSTNARTFARPPDAWNIGSWDRRWTWFAGSPQTLTADYLHEGATGASGHVWEPYLHLTPRPDLLLPAYYQGRNLAESYYLAIPALSWTNVVIGDPLCSLKSVSSTRP